MAVLGRNDINSVEDCTCKDIYIKEWGGSVSIGPMTVSERLKFEAEQKQLEKDGSDEEIAKLHMYGTLVSSVKDSNGKPLYDEETILEMGNRNIHAVTTLYRACLDINFISPDIVKGLKKNLEETT